MDITAEPGNDLDAAWTVALEQLSALRPSHDLASVHKDVLQVFGDVAKAVHVELWRRNELVRTTDDGCAEAGQVTTAATPRHHAVAAINPTNGVEYRLCFVPDDKQPAPPEALLKLAAERCARVIGVSELMNEEHRHAAELDRFRGGLAALKASLAVTHEIGRTGYYRFNLATGSNWWSDEVFRFYGLDPATTKLSLDVFRAGIHADDRDRIVAEIGKAFWERKAWVTFYRTLGPDGALRYVKTSFRPANDDPRGDFVGTNLDLSERRRATDLIAAAQSELADALRLARLDELSSSLVHGLSQPLTAVVASAAAALRWLDGEGGNLERVKTSIEAIVRSKDRAGEFIGILRTLATRAVSKADPVIFDAAMADIVTIAEAEAEKCNVILSHDLRCGEQALLGDRIQLQQLFLSLVLSAIQVAQHRCRVVAIQTAENSDRLELSVTFDGESHDLPGFDFVSEFVTGRTDTMHLWLSKAIAENHGGSVSFDRLPGQVCRLRVELPAHDRQP